MCSQERRQNGDIHYDMAVKLDQNWRRLTVRNYADKKHGLKLNFSSSHANYFLTWKYTTKDDKEYLETQGHPDLKNEPQTQEPKTHCRNGRKWKTQEKEKTRTAAPAIDLWCFPSGSVKALRVGYNELLSLANHQKKGGKTDLAKFIANHGCKQ